MNKIERIKELTKELSLHCVQYYKYDAPIITDKEYDILYDELVQLEKETGVVLSNSPTQKVQGFLLDGFTKVKHSKPMLSAEKTKLIEDLYNFKKEQDLVLSYKMDGLTIVLKYENGNFTQGITRGDGEYGEDVTENIKLFTNVPLTIPYKNYLEVRGEGVISWDNFNKINEELPLEERYSHPRNLAAGSVRQLDPSITKQRHLEFVAFDLVSANEWDGLLNSKYNSLDFLSKLGFTVVEHIMITNDVVNIAFIIDYVKTIEEALDLFTKESTKYPIDGDILEYDNLYYGSTLGATSHHENRIIAYKFEDESVKTILRDIIWETSRNGDLYPVAVFDEIDVEGVKITRCSLHNINFIKELELGIGDTVAVSRRNMVIPYMEDNLTRSNTYKLPTLCPSCWSLLEERKVDKTVFLSCSNIKGCPAQKLARMTHFCSKKALNIDGLSGQTLERLINNGWVNNFKDIFHLEKYKDEIIKTEGFGERSLERLQLAIENARNTTLDRFITALGILNIGTTASKTISKYFNGNFDEFYKNALVTNFSELKDFGETTYRNIYEFFKEERYNEHQWVQELALEFNFIVPQVSATTIQDNPFKDKTVVVTGTLENFTRDSIAEKLESLNAKVSGSVSKKTNYLIYGTNAGSKLSKAQDLGVTTLNEKEFLEMIG